MGRILCFVLSFICFSACIISLWTGCASHSAAVQQAATPPPAAQGSSPQPDGIPAPVMPSLPAPHTLNKGASAPPTEDDRCREGYAYNSGLPHAHMQSDQFNPNYDPLLSPSLDDAAYAIFQFENMTDYVGSARIKLAWDSEPTDYANLYLALANFSADRWDWRRVTAQNLVYPPALSTYISATGQLYAVVLLTGTDDARLDWLLIGDNLTPDVFFTTDLNSDPLLNLAPLTVNFNASYSYSVGGAIESYDFDWESDGTWDLEDNQDGLANHLFAPGEWTTTVRAWDDSGLAGTRSLTFLAIDPANQPPVASFLPSVLNGDAPLAVDFDATGSSDPDGTIIKYEWDFNSDGIYEVDQSGVPLASHTFGRSGANIVHLRVIDNFLATDTTLASIVLAHGWNRSVVDSDVQVVRPTSMCVSGTGVNARACVAYQDWPGRDLRFCRATAEDGSGWGAVATPVGAADDTGYGPSLAIVPSTQAPAIAYGTYNIGVSAYSQYFVSATDYTAGVWNAPVQVGAGDGSGGACALRLINSSLAIASVSQYGVSGLSHIDYYVAADPVGAFWDAAVEVMAAQTGAQYEGLSMSTTGSGMFKFPAISYLLMPQSSVSQLNVVLATNAAGTDWATPIFLGQVDTRTTSLTRISTVPALCAGSPVQDGNLYYARADDANGATWGGGLHQIGGGGYGDLVALSGNPATCYYDMENIGLWFVTSYDPAGAAWYQPYQVDSVGTVGEYCSMTVVNGNPVICYYDSTNQRLLAAYWQ